MFLRPGEIIEFLKNKKYIIKGMKGADFGCGAGYFTGLLANSVGIDGVIYAIDIQEEVLKEAQEFLKNLDLNNVKFLLQNLEINSGLESNFLDFVFISQVLYQNDSFDKIIKEAYRVLKTEGYLIVLEPQVGNLLFSGQKIIPPEQVSLAIEKNGFKIIDINQNSNYYLLIAQK